MSTRRCSREPSGRRQEQSGEQRELAAFVDYAKRNSTIVILERKPAEKLLSDYRVLLGLDPDLGGAAAAEE